MKFLCLIYEVPDRVKALSKTELDNIVKQYFAFTEDLERSGHLETGDSLKPGHTPTTIRMNHGQAFTSFGPQENIENTIGGFFVIQARDLDEAVALMSRVPGLNLGGSVEIRPIHDWKAKRT